MKLDFMKDIFSLHKMDQANYFLLGLLGNRFVILKTQSQDCQKGHYNHLRKYICAATLC